jgi:hypothetical protein
MQTDNTDRKIREAQFFLGRLIEHSQRFPSGRVAPDNQEEFAYYLSAFLSAAYGVLPGRSRILEGERRLRARGRRRWRECRAAGRRPCNIKDVLLRDVHVP